MKSAALALLLVAGCAHLESRAAAPGDERAVVVILSTDSICDGCRALEAALADSRVVAALPSVRVVRYDTNSPSGSAALERLMRRYVEGSPPWMFGVVDERAVRALHGAPASVETLLSFIADVAALGGNGAEYAAMADDAPPDRLLRAARWHDAHQHTDAALALWRRLSAKADATPDARAEADWSLARIARKGEAWAPRAALDFAAQHPATLFGWQTLLAARTSHRVTRAEIADLLRKDFAAAAALDRQPEVVLVAVAVGDVDVALELAKALVDGHPSTAKQMLAFAEVLYARGQPDEAVKIGERALAAAPDSPSVREALQRYRAHRGLSPFVVGLLGSAVATSASLWIGE